MTADEIISELEQLADPRNLAILDRYSIKTPKAFGIRTPVVKLFAREVRKLVPDRHAAALEIWGSGIYEARAVATLIDYPRSVTPEQMDAWAADFDNWATVDGTSGYLFCRTPHAYDKAFEWAQRDEEFVRRAAFSLMAYLAVHDKKAPDEKLATFFPVIEKYAFDERNFVKKAVNWALRQTGKRNKSLNALAVDAAERIKLQNTPSARWIASDALRELRNDAVRERLNRRK